MSEVEGRPLAKVNNFTHGLITIDAFEGDVSKVSALAIVVAAAPAANVEKGW